MFMFINAQQVKVNDRPDVPNTDYQQVNIRRKLNNIIIED